MSIVRAVAAYLKVVRRRKPSSAEGMTGESTRGLGGGGWGPPPGKNLNFERFYVRFNGVFMRLGPDFSRFGHKGISCRRETECWTKLFSDSHMVSFYFFLFSMFL